jgi:hypothetical protein
MPGRAKELRTDEEHVAVSLDLPMDSEFCQVARDPVFGLHNGYPTDNFLSNFDKLGN